MVKQFISSLLIMSVVGRARGRLLIIGIGLASSLVLFGNGCSTTTLTEVDEPSHLREDVAWQNFLECLDSRPRRAGVSDCDRIAGPDGQSRFQYVGGPVNPGYNDPYNPDPFDGNRLRGNSRDLDHFYDKSYREYMRQLSSHQQQALVDGYRQLIDGNR